MKFTVETKPFLRMLELLVQTPASRKHSERNLRIVAHHDRVCAQWDEAIAEIEAAVWGGGRCTVPAQKLMAVLRSLSELRVSIEADVGILRVGDCAIPLVHYQRVAAPRGRLQIFFASTTGLIPSPAPLRAEFALVN